ncbi:MAG TPA: DUF5666 domain-containing protein [Ktedonobacterales bacterium]|nr:DUF5666 domain-containing protein [Ktedonobacterales bacterium]
MLVKRLLPLGAVGLLAGLALAGCGGSAAANTVSVTPTPTCPATPQFQVATGTITAVNSTQMTVQTTKGEALVTLSARTRYSSQQKTSASDIQDGTRVQVIVKANSDGTYSAVQVAIRQATGTGTGGGNGGGFPGGNPTPRGTATPGPRRTATPGAGIPARCRPTGAGRGGAGGLGGGTGTVEGGLPAGAKVLSGTVATISGPNMTITGTDGTNYNVKLDSATIYSKIGAAKVTDLKIGAAVTATGAKASNGSIAAQAVTILLALPTGQ